MLVEINVFDEPFEWQNISCVVHYSHSRTNTHTDTSTHIRRMKRCSSHTRTQYIGYIACLNNNRIVLFSFIFFSPHFIDGVGKCRVYEYICNSRYCSVHHHKTCVCFISLVTICLPINTPKKQIVFCPSSSFFFLSLPLSLFRLSSLLFFVPHRLTFRCCLVCVFGIDRAFDYVYRMSSYCYFIVITHRIVSEFVVVVVVVTMMVGVQ